MDDIRKNHTHGFLAKLATSAGLFSLVLVFALTLTGGGAMAAPLAATAPGLGEAANYSALGKAGVTNTGNSVLSGNVGADSSITGFPPGTAAGMIIAPAVNQAEADASTADLALTAQAGGATNAGPDLTGANLVPGVYSVGSALLSGALTLNGPGVYIFLADALTSSGSVSLTNGATACDVFWHVTSSASITGGSFVGTIIAGTSITFGDAVSLDGRALALTGNVTLINDHIFGPSCAAGSTGTATATSTTSAATATVGSTTEAATPTVTSGSASTATPQALLSETGVDRAEMQALATRQWMRLGLGVIGLGLILAGLTLRHKHRA